MGLVHYKINSNFTERCSSSQLDKIVSANFVFTCLIKQNSGSHVARMWGFFFFWHSEFVNGILEASLLAFPSAPSQVGIDFSGPFLGVARFLSFRSPGRKARLMSMSPFPSELDKRN